MEDLRRFFDHYLKGIENGWEDTPRVRLSIYDQGGTDQVDRPEEEWPIPGIEYRKLYLDAQLGTLATELPEKESLVRYTSDDDKGHATFTIKFDKDTELTGYFKLHLWVQADGSDDMDLFVTIDKLDNEGKPLKGEGLFAYGGPDGRLRVSHRELDARLSTEWFPFHTHRSEEKLSPGQIVLVEISIRPTGILWHRDQQLRITIAGHNPAHSPMAMRGKPFTRNKGEHIIHTGGKYDSHLLVPEVLK
jgi:putative CocE/NonD family hydrolase